MHGRTICRLLPFFCYQSFSSYAHSGTRPQEIEPDGSLVRFGLQVIVSSMSVHKKATAMLGAALGGPALKTTSPLQLDANAHSGLFQIVAAEWEGVHVDRVNDSHASFFGAYFSLS